VAISTKASIREMMLPGAIALVTPVLVGFIFGPEVLGGLLAGVTVSGVLMGIFQSNAGGAWDNAKKSFEKGVVINGETFYKKSEPHKASVTGDTVGDPFKDTSGPSMNILIKLMSIVSLVIAPYIVGRGGASTSGGEGQMVKKEMIILKINGIEYRFNSKAQADSMMATMVKDVNELKGNFEVDAAHSSVGFSVRHLVTDTRGTINIDSGYVNMDNANGPKIYIEMDMKSLNTQNEYRDGHLAKEEFFNIEKFPKAIYQATEVVKDTAMDAEYHYIAKGKLTMKGVTKDLEMYFNYLGTQDQEYEGNKSKVAGFEGRTAIPRGEFGIGSSGGIGENVKIMITLEASQSVK